jgi:tetratricopeptide (TPR) repeat protein
LRNPSCKTLVLDHWARSVRTLALGTILSTRPQAAGARDAEGQCRARDQWDRKTDKPNAILLETDGMIVLIADKENINFFPSDLVSYQGTAETLALIQPNPILADGRLLPICFNVGPCATKIGMDRIATLAEILAQDPNNVLARYGLAMEYANAGQTDRALDEFGKLLSANPDYGAGYFMAAQTLVKANRSDEAKKMLVDGIAAAQRKRDSHAESEMQAMLDELS